MGHEGNGKTGRRRVMLSWLDSTTSLTLVALEGVRVEVADGRIFPQGFIHNECFCNHVAFWLRCGFELFSQEEMSAGFGRLAKPRAVGSFF